MSDNSIIGFFVSSNMGDKNSQKFRDFLWKEFALSNKLSVLDKSDYDGGLDIILFEFYINPYGSVIRNLGFKYVKKEKAIKYPIIITDKILDKTGKELEKSILNLFNLELDKLKIQLEKENLNFSMDIIISDIRKILSQHLDI